MAISWFSKSLSISSLLFSTQLLLLPSDRPVGTAEEEEGKEEDRKAAEEEDALQDNGRMEVRLWMGSGWEEEG
jgi:hypothetical protein